MYASAYQMLGGRKSEMATVEKSIALIRNGLPVSALEKGTQLLGVTKTEYARLIGVNLRSLQRKQQASGHLSPAASEHALMLAEMVRLADEYFPHREATLRWLNQPVVALGNLSPLSVCDTYTGIHLVTEEINKLKYGLTA
jgi:putative toxin-antitoxin system antitoxin component (TIGR02293 family)